MGYKQKKWGGEVQDEVQAFGRQEIKQFSYSFMYSVKFLSCLSLKQSVSMWSQSRTRTSSSKVRDKEVFKISKYVSTLLGLSQVPFGTNDP